MANGNGCKCAAHSAAECGCDADWTPQEVYDLRAEIERLRSQPCPYVTGTVTQHCTLTPLTLTDAEREAIERLAIHCANTHCVDTARTLWGLLSRTQDGGK